MTDEAPIKGPVEILSNSEKHSDHQLVDDAGQRITVYFDGIEDEEEMFRYIAACINRAPLLERAEWIIRDEYDGGRSGHDCDCACSHCSRLRAWLADYAATKGGE